MTSSLQHKLKFMIIKKELGKNKAKLKCKINKSSSVFFIKIAHFNQSPDFFGVFVAYGQDFTINWHTSSVYKAGSKIYAFERKVQTGIDAISCHMTQVGRAIVNLSTKRHESQHKKLGIKDSCL